MPEITEIRGHPQTPDLSWHDWVGQTLGTLRFFRESGGPDLTEPLRILNHEIPFAADFRQIMGKNAALIRARNRNLNDTFYRPGLGGSGLLWELLEFAGTFREMVVTDPIYAEEKMAGISPRILPLDYYRRTLQLAQARDIKIRVGRDLLSPAQLIHPEAYEEITIPDGGKGQVDFRLNGVNLRISLLTADMTTFWLPNYQILGLGNARPVEAGTADPRSSLDFRAQALFRLAQGGVISYTVKGVNFFPPKMMNRRDLKEFGVKEIWQFRDQFVFQKEKLVDLKELKGLFAITGTFRVRNERTAPWIQL